MIKIKLENNSYKLEGKFEFSVTKTVYTEKFEPKQTIMFDWCPELPQDINTVEYTMDIHEMIAEKLKVDFLNVLKNNTIKEL